jgi:hypothetical protein
MPDIFLRQGAAGPSDIVLRDPTTIGATTSVSVTQVQAAQTESSSALADWPAVETQPIGGGGFTAAEMGRRPSFAVDLISTNAVCFEVSKHHREAAVCTAVSRYNEIEDEELILLALGLAA